MASKLHLRGLVLAATLAFTGSANAQDQSANYAAAGALIQSAQARDLFEPVTHERLISVRHTASGMVCHFSNSDTRAQLAVFANLPRGEDVGCVSDSEGQATTLYATRYNPAITAEESLAIAVTSLQARFTNAQPTPLLAEVSTEGMPPLHAAYFLITLNGERWITGAITAQSGPWIYKLRYTARAVEDEDLMRHQLEAAAMLTLVLLELSPGQST